MDVPLQSLVNSGKAYESNFGIDEIQTESQPEICVIPIPIVRFTDKSVKLIFIRKVFSIIAIQMLVLEGILATTLYQLPFVNQLIVRPSPYYQLFMSIGIFAFALGVYGAEFQMANSCTKLVFIAILTISCGFEIGVITGCSEWGGAILICIGIIIFICLTFVLFTFQKKWDFERLYSFRILWASTIFLLFIFTINKILWRQSSSNGNGNGSDFTILMSGLIAILICSFLVYNLHQIINAQTNTTNQCSNEDRDFQLFPKQYIWTAISLSLYLILILFTLGFILLMIWIGIKDEERKSGKIQWPDLERIFQNNCKYLPRFEPELMTICGVRF